MAQGPALDVCGIEMSQHSRGESSRDASICDAVARVARETAKWRLRVDKWCPRGFELASALTQGFDAAANSAYLRWHTLEGERECVNPFIVERDRRSVTYEFAPRDFARAFLLHSTAHEAAQALEPHLERESMQGVAFLRAVREMDARYLHVLAHPTPREHLWIEPRSKYNPPYERGAGGTAYQLAALNGDLEQIQIQRFIPSRYRSRTEYVWGDKRELRIGNVREDYAGRPLPCAPAITQRAYFRSVLKALRACEGIVLFNEYDLRWRPGLRALARDP